MKNSTLQNLRIIITAFFLIVPFILPAQTITVSGEITADTTWAADTVKVTGDILIRDSIKLTIAPGTYIEFQGFYEIEVFGTLVAAGTPEDTIIFTCHPDSTVNGWKGLVFNDRSVGIMFDNDSSKISHCRIEYGKPLKYDPGTPRGVITVWEFSRLIITNSVFANNYAIHGGAILCRDQADISIINNYFIQNTSDYAGSAIYISNAGPHVSNNTFIDNKGPLSAGGSARIVNNMFYNNNSYAIECSSNPLIIGNIISNNQRGMSISRSNSLIVNNTICNNEYGIHCYDIMNSQFYNNIIWGNQNYQVEIGSIGSQPDFYNCDIQGSDGGFTGSYSYNGTYIDNLEIDPQFISPSAGAGSGYDGLTADWSLHGHSQCLNKGYTDVSELKLPDKDIMGAPRILYSRVDLGAIEYHRDSVQIFIEITNDTTYLADTIAVLNDVTIPDDVTLTILPGTIVEFHGHYHMKVFGTLIAEGNESDTIIFTIRDTTGFENENITDGGWGSLIFNNGPSYNGGADGTMIDNDTSSLKYCKFSYGKAVGTEWEEKLGGAIMVYQFSRIRIEHCAFENNFAQDYGGALMLWTADKLEVKNNTFINNRSVIGGALYIRGCQKLYVSDNIFFNNFSHSGGAICLTQSEETKIINNTFSNNDGWNGGAIRIEWTNNGILINNLFCNNKGSNGGAVDQYVSPGFVFINNTVSYNQAGKGGGFYIHSSQPAIYNSIFWGNYPEEINIATLKSQPDIYHSDIKGGTDAFGGEQFLGLYENNLDEDPSFVNPTSGAGYTYDGLTADWSLLPLSPCINKGTTDIPDIEFPEVDLNSSVRIHKDLIDMGAYENQSDIPVILKQPENKIKCEGQSTVLSVEVTDTAYFQWQKDDTIIPGENRNVLTFDSLTNKDEGNYWCIVKNAYGSVTGNTVTLFVIERPEFLIEPSDLWVEKGKTITLSTWAKGTNPGFQWQKNEVNINGAISPELIIPDIDYDAENIYRCIVKNSCGADTTASINLYLAPQICMVTVDPLTGHNLVIWEKNSTAPLLTYYIYRESKASGIYDLKGTVSHEDLSIFIDSTADPTVQAYLYKITGIDTSGNETDIDLCKPHKTIHLLVSTNPELNTTQLEWDKYYGFEYQTYNILRSATGTNFAEVHSIASSLASWTDPDPLPEVGYYRIAVEKPLPWCMPTGGSKKAESGPYSHSMSNIEDNRLQEVQENQAPTDMNLTNNTIAENQSIGTLVGRLTTTDADTSDHHTYKLVSGSGDQDNNRFTTLGDLLITAEILDYEIKDTLSVRIKSTDKGDLSVEGSFIILVTDVNEGTGNLAPTDITLSFNSIDENKPVGTLIGKFQTTDPNEEDMHTYGLVEGLGGDDNNSFSVLADMLISATEFDYETKGEYTIRVRSRDDGDGRLSFEKSYTIYVNDLLETGLADHHSSNQIQVYPNPFSETTTLTFNNQEGDSYSLYIMDLSGKVCRIVDNITTSEYVLEKGELKEGFYFVELRGPTIYRGKIVLE